MRKTQLLYKYLKMNCDVDWAFYFEDGAYGIKIKIDLEYYPCSRITERTILKLIRLL